MERKQKIEWDKAQKIVISEDLVAAAKHQLRLLAEVDKNRCLYDGPILDRAIYRYKNCWLPLVAKYTKSNITEGPLVAPLDCEWIWHCHRLNPVRYKADCEEFYGKILGNQDVVSSVQGVSKKQTEEIWKRMYPNEPYELDMSTQFADNVAEIPSGTPETTKYDLHSAVKRQSCFFYQVSRPHMKDDLFLEGALARYKGFLHLIRRNKERGIRRFCVPTYDIDLIWHSHQLQPVSYSKDLVTLLGKVLEHDDTDSDRTKGKKLDTGYCDTTKQWEETFGFKYWRAGAMYRGNVPSPLTINLGQIGIMSRKLVPSNDYEDMIKLPEKMFVEVMAEIVAVKNLPSGHKESLFVTCSKKQSDPLFNAKRKLSISSETGRQEVALFQCEPTGELVFELLSCLPSKSELLGTVSIPLQDFMNSGSELWIEKWFQLVANYGVVCSKPIDLRIALSFTLPIPAPYVLQLAPPERFRQAKGWTDIVDEAGNEVIKIQMRDLTNAEETKTCLARKEVIGITPLGETCTLAEFSGAGWSLMNSNWLFQLQNKFSETEDIYELTGSRKVIIFPGRKLEFELNNCENQKVEHNFMTAVEFSVENPHGKAVALLNLKSGSLKVNEKWLLLPGVLLAFILSSDGSLREKGFGGTVNAVGELAEDHNKKGNYEDEKMVKSRGCYSCCGGHGGCSSCGNCGGGGWEGDHDHEKMVKSSGCFGSCGGHGGCSSCSSCGGRCGAEAEAEECVGNYDHEKMVKSSGRFGSCGGHGGCSSCINCGGRCGAEAEECVGNYEHEKMVKSSGCYGPCGGHGGCSSCSSCSNCGGGGCRSEATNEAVAA